MKNEENVEKCWMCTSHSTITNNTERLRPNTTELKKNNLHLTYPIQIHPAKPHEYLTNEPRCSSKLKLSNIFNQLKKSRFFENFSHRLLETFIQEPGT